MLDIFFALLAAGLNSAPSTPPQAQITPPAEAAPAQQADVQPGGSGGQGVQAQGAQDAEGFDMSVVPTGLTADPQAPSGKFTTAAEVKPILDATRANWVVVREYEGKDWLYVTHVWSWRCGLKAMAISVNGETMQNWPMPPCREQFTTPNALLEDDPLPVLTFRPGSVQTITIQVVYDDLSMGVASFERGNVLIP